MTCVCLRALDFEAREVRMVQYWFRIRQKEKKTGQLTGPRISGPHRKLYQWRSCSWLDSCPISPPFQVNSAVLRIPVYYVVSLIRTSGTLHHSRLRYKRTIVCDCCDGTNTRCIQRRGVGSAQLFRWVNSLSLNSLVAISRRRSITMRKASRLLGHSQIRHSRIVRYRYFVQFDSRVKNYWNVLNGSMLLSAHETRDLTIKMTVFWYVAPCILVDDPSSWQ